MNKALKDEDVRLGYMTVLDYLERYSKSYQEYYGEKK
jgi:hypothetical protein